MSEKAWVSGTLAGGVHVRVTLSDDAGKLWLEVSHQRDGEECLEEIEVDFLSPEPEKRRCYCLFRHPLTGDEVEDFEKRLREAQRMGDKTGEVIYETALAGRKACPAYRQK